MIESNFTVSDTPLTDTELESIDAWWRAALHTSKCAIGLADFTGPLGVIW